MRPFGDQDVRDFGAFWSKPRPRDLKGAILKRRRPRRVVALECQIGLAEHYGD
jgi:hypothetical protein